MYVESAKVNPFILPFFISILTNQHLARKAIMHHDHDKASQSPGIVKTPQEVVVLIQSCGRLYVRIEFKERI